MNIVMLRSSSIAWNIISRCRVILKAFIFEGEVQVENIKERVRLAEERFDTLEKLLEKLRTDLGKKINNLVERATKGALVLRGVAHKYV